MNSQALYLQLKNNLINLIHSDLAPGDYLPSERKISEKYNLSRTTVRAALKELEALGYIDIIHGKGSMVLDPTEQKINLTNLYSFTENIHLLGMQPSNQILEFSVIPSTAKVGDKLNIPKNNPVVFIKRLRLADDTPLLLEETYLSKAIFHDLKKEDIVHSSLYDLMQNHYHVKILSAKEEFRAGLTNQQTSSYLKISENDPVLIIQRQTYGTNNQILEYTKSTARSDKFIFKTTHINHNQ